LDPPNPVEEARVKEEAELKVTVGKTLRMNRFKEEKSEEEELRECFKACQGSFCHS